MLLSKHTYGNSEGFYEVSKSNKIVITPLYLLRLYMLCNTLVANSSVPRTLALRAFVPQLY